MVVAKRHSHGTKLAAVFLAQQTSEHEAATVFGVPRSTIHRWAGNVTIPDDQWSAIQAVLLARASEMTARGQTSGLVQTMTAAGIASRNVRYAEVTARYDARKAEQSKPDEPSPVAIQIDRLDESRVELLRDEIALVAVRRASGLDPEPPDADDATADAALVTVIDRMVSMTDEQVAARMAAIGAERYAFDAVEREQERLERERIAAEREAAKPPPRGYEFAKDVTPRTRELDPAEAELVAEALAFLEMHS